MYMVEEINSCEQFITETTAQPPPTPFCCTTPIIFQNANNPSKILFLLSSKNIFVKSFVVQEYQAYYEDIITNYNNKKNCYWPLSMKIYEYLKIIIACHFATYLHNCY